MHTNTKLMLFSILIMPALISLVLTLDNPQQLIGDTDSNLDHKHVSNVVMRWSVARNPTKEEFSKIIDLRSQCESLLDRKLNDFHPVYLKTWETITMNYLVKVLIDS